MAQWLYIVHHETMSHTLSCLHKSTSENEHKILGILNFYFPSYVILCLAISALTDSTSLANDNVSSLKSSGCANYEVPVVFFTSW